MLARIGLEIADRVAAALPAPVAYGLADLAGDAWHRFAPGRRRLVAANLARVCEATGRPSRGRAFRALVRSAFRNHARYYLELLRGPHYQPGQIDEIVDVPEWAKFESVLRSGPTVLISSHLGNFEPFGAFLAAHGFVALSPIEEIEPRALYEFLAARRGTGRIDLVPLRDARTAIGRRLRGGGLVGIIGDRLVAGGGQTVSFFGHPASVPTGPAALALQHGASVIVGRSLRAGPDRYIVEGEVLEIPSSGDRRADTLALTERIAARFERDVAAAPEQWWGAFQAYWPDLEA